MWRDSFRIPPHIKIFNGVRYSVFHTLERTKEEANKRAVSLRSKGWRIRIVKFAYQTGIYAYVLYGNYVGRKSKK